MPLPPPVEALQWGLLTPSCSATWMAYLTTEGSPAAPTHLQGPFTPRGLKTYHGISMFWSPSSGWCPSCPLPRVDEEPQVQGGCSHSEQGVHGTGLLSSRSELAILRHSLHRVDKARGREGKRIGGGVGMTQTWGLHGP